MKNIYKFAILVAAAALSFSSCDLLEEENFGKPTTDAMLQNEENVVSLVGQAYADLRFMHDHWGYWGVNTLTADEGLCPIRKGGDWNDGGYWKYLNTHEWNAYGEAFKNAPVLPARCAFQVVKFPKDGKVEIELTVAL